MLFKVISGKSIFDLNPELKAIHEFERLTARQMTYVALFTDYKTPFRKLSLEDKKFQAAITAGYLLEADGKRLDKNGRNVVDGKDGKIEAAIMRYKDIQYDEDYESLLAIRNLIGQVRDLNNKPDKDINTLNIAVALTVGKLDKLIETKKRIEEILDVREDNVVETAIGAPIVVDSDEYFDESNLSILGLQNEGKI